MSGLQIIDALCEIIEMQARLIYRLASTLEQIDCLDAAAKQSMSAATAAYENIMGISAK